YVNTKAMAVRLMLQKGKPKLAENHLLQLEEAARQMFTDVREAILGLRLTNACCEDFFDQIRLFTEDYTELNGIPVTYAIAPNVIPAPQLDDGETQLQLMRIVQEALANVRKHAIASHVWITFRRNRNQLVLSIKDNGVGFNATDIQIECNRTLPPFKHLENSHTTGSGSGGTGLFMRRCPMTCAM
ncbi:MAG: sensor histidine kinase, partial [Saprospiraceae bacterium]